VRKQNKEKNYVNNSIENKIYIKLDDFYYDGEEWTYFGASIDEFDFDEDEEEDD
jgi:hypothetical protein